ncbi:MAG: LacI family DNA-binding transcriptional regulator [Lachnospiraceae bacterium]|nr:LacI family DNA-binding transcriptional regulator [Lachnospiraceae bacterium]
MKDVAQEAGVSLGTVSKVFNNIPVGEDYRHRVREAAEKLGYQINSYARGLKTNRTQTVALILPLLHHPFFSALAEQLTGALMQRGYRALLFITNFDPDAEQRCIDMVRQNKADGIIALTYHPELRVDEGLPFVSIDRHFGTSIPCVSADNFGGGYLAGEKLISFGCKKPLFLRSGSHVVGEPDKRFAGFDACCRNAGLPCESLTLHDADGFTPFFEFLDKHVIRKKPSFDGIFCNTDSLTLLICDYLRSHGVRVPEDVQLIGFDGIKSLGTERYVCSTIVQPVAEMAQMAVDVLLTDSSAQSSALISLPVHYAYGGTTLDGEADV